jgi:hypothetical protein
MRVDKYLLFFESFSDRPDTRPFQGQQNNLLDRLFIALSAILCAGDDIVI